MRKLLSVILCITLLLVPLTACSNRVIEIDFSDLAEEYLTYIGNNFVGSDKSAEKKEDLKEYIISELKKAGYKDSQIEVTTIGNIVLSVKGADTSKQIIVGGHYDGDGVGDNGSGVALILATAVGLAKTTTAYNVKYIFFDLEEYGLVGSKNYASHMTQEEVDSTLFMLNIDSIAFGDYVNVYGGKYDPATNSIINREYYDKAMEYAKELGFNVYLTEDLDGYFAEHGEGPALDPIGVFTNPWTAINPSPRNMMAESPTLSAVTDHAEFEAIGIPYICFEAANWYAEGSIPTLSYTGYYETADESLGECGMFMNTKYDTLENLEKYFPGRSLEHFRIYSPILSKLLLEK